MGDDNNTRNFRAFRHVSKNYNNANFSPLETLIHSKFTTPLQGHLRKPSPNKDYAQSLLKILENLN